MTDDSYEDYIRKNAIHVNALAGDHLRFLFRRIDQLKEELEAAKAELEAAKAVPPKLKRVAWFYPRAYGNGLSFVKPPDAEAEPLYKIVNGDE